jgi:hypothetical protein
MTLMTVEMCCKTDAAGKYPVTGRQVANASISAQRDFNCLRSTYGRPGCAAQMRCTGHRGAWFVPRGAPAPSKFSFPTGPQYLLRPDPLIGSPGEEPRDAHRLSQSSKHLGDR